MKCRFFFLAAATAVACNTPAEKKGGEPVVIATTVDTAGLQPVQNTDTPKSTVAVTKPVNNLSVGMNGVTPRQLVGFAATWQGVPYKYASADPAQGFDCSGFITYVFNHFNIEVPRSSVDFTSVGQEVALPQAREGDLILFTGTNDSIRIVGHMGIVTENTDTLKFIHSSSGRANGVTISPLNDHYRRRFVKVIRVFPG